MFINIKLKTALINIFAEYLFVEYVLWLNYNNSFIKKFAHSVMACKE